MHIYIPNRGRNVAYRVYKNSQYLHNYKLKKNSDIIQKLTYHEQLYTESQNRLGHDFEKWCNVETV